MIVTLDGRRLNADFAPEQTLQSVLDGVGTKLASDRLVVAVARDGRELTGEALDRALTGQLGATAQVDVESATRQEVAADALRDVAARIEQVGAEQAQIAAELNAGRSEQAIQRLSPFLETWQAAQRTILQCCHVLQRDLTTFEHDGRSLQEHLGSLADSLRELRRAFQAGDMVLLADVLEYELPPLCQRWCALLTDLAASVRGDGG